MESLSRHFQKYPHYETGEKVLPEDRVRHIETGRTGIMHGLRPGGRILVRWIDENGNRLRRSTVNLSKLRFVERGGEFKGVAA